MILKYTLYEKDYLEFHLYWASTNKRLRNQRLKSTLTLAGIFFFLGFLRLVQDSEFDAYLFSTIALVFLIFYPFYQRYIHKTHYKRFVADAHKKRFGLTSTVVLGEDAIFTASSMVESRFFLSGIEAIEETGNYFYAKVKSGEMLIVPKSEVDKDAVRSYFQTLTQQLNIPYTVNLNWKWK